MKNLDTLDKVLIPVMITGFVFIVGIYVGIELIIGTAISNNIKTFFVFYMLLLLIVLVIIAIFVTNRYVKKPMNELSSFLESIKNDKYESFEEVFNNTDIDDFTKQVNKLIEYLGQKDQKTKQLIDTLKDSNKNLEEYKKAVDASAIISKFDNQGFITYANEQFVSISRYSQKEIIGRRFNFTKHHDIKEEFFTSLWNEISNKRIFVGEIKNLDKNNEEYYTSTVIVPILDSNDEILEYLSFSIDITEHIHSLIKAKNAEASKSIFLATMSHEIRTPLNGILGFTKLLEKADLPKKEKGYTQIINSSANSLLGVINDILDISKIESGKLELEKKEFNPFKEFEPAIELFVAKANEKNIDILFYIDPNLPSRIIGDPLKIKQVISNLLGNAIKFTPQDGEITIRIELEVKNENKAFIIFSVKDSGIGIPKEKQKTIFEPFSQADSSVTREFGGTGLGLSISSNIISVMGSKIELLSEENQGSQFYFTLELEYLEAKNLYPQIDKNSKIAIFCEEYDCKSQLGMVKQYLSNYSEPNITFDPEELKGFSLVVLNYEDLKYLNTKDLKIPLVIITDYEEHIINDLEVEYIIIKAPINQSKLYDAIVDLLNPNLKEEVLIDKELSHTWDIDCLVVEDNNVNQHLMDAMLSAKNIRVHFANNGQEAVDKIKSGETFNLIFMDINMPVLNGIDATKKILKYEKEEGIEHTPIVALTANAVAGDKEKFLEAGMDNYMSKPFEESELNSILHQYIVIDKENIINENEEIKKEEKSEFIYDIEEAAQSLGLQVTIFKTILNAFVSSIDEDLDLLKEAIDSNNYENIREVAHKIKGASANLKIKEVASLLNEIELNAKDSIDIEYNVKFEQLKSKIESIKKVVQG